MENDRHHREALAAVHQKAAEELGTALQAHKEKLEWGTREHRSRRGHFNIPGIAAANICGGRGPRWFD